MTDSLLDSQTTGLVVVDAQTKLLDVMRRGQVVVDNIVRLLHLAERFRLPVIATRQYPKMMGTIAPEIAELLSERKTTEGLPEERPIEKMDFDCCAVGEFTDRLKATCVESVILTGIEAHICILQTCLSLLDADYRVHIPQDAVDSRTEENWRVGIELMREAGAVISSTETAVFQVLRKAGTPEFKEMLRLIK